MADTNRFAFEVSVSGEYRPFTFDISLQKLTGTEALLIDRHAGDMQQWIGRMTAGNPTGADIVLIAFLCARREQIEQDGSTALDWDAFAETVAPYTLRTPGEPTATVPNRADRRRSGAAAKAAAQA